MGIYVCLIVAIGEPSGDPQVILDASGHRIRIAGTAHRGWRDLIVEITTRSPALAKFNGTIYEFDY